MTISIIIPAHNEEKYIADCTRGDGAEFLQGKNKSNVL